MDVKEALFSLGMMAVSALAAYFLFRRSPREKVISRGPVFIVCFLLFFYVGFFRGAASREYWDHEGSPAHARETFRKMIECGTIAWAQKC